MVDQCAVGKLDNIYIICLRTHKDYDSRHNEKWCRTIVAFKYYIQTNIVLNRML